MISPIQSGDFPLHTLQAEIPQLAESVNDQAFAENSMPHGRIFWLHYVTVIIVVVM